MRRHFTPILLLGLALPACEGFTCSQARIKAIELNNRGVEAMKNNLYDTAEKEFKQAIQTDPSYEMSHYNLGKTFQKQRKWDKAAEAFEAAVQRMPTNGQFQYDLGEAYEAANKLDEAEKALKAAATADPKLFKAHWRLGAVYKRLERSKEADTALRAAIDANPRFDKPFVALGYLYLDYDFNKEAEQVFRACLAGNGESAECANGHGMALKELKQFADATSAFKKALDLDSGLNDAIYNCGMTYSEWYEASHSNEHKDRAREFLQKFVATGGGKGSDPGYVKAANDKLYALSGP